MAGETIADLLEAPPIDLPARGFGRVTRARRAWDKRISDDIVWRISIDDDREGSIVAGVVMPFFAGCRRFTTLIPPPYDWEQEVVRNPSDRRGLLARAINVQQQRRLGQSTRSEISIEQLTWAIEQQALPYLERYTTLQAVLDDVVEKNGRLARDSHDKTTGYFGLCDAALLRWRLGDLAGADADLDGAQLLITRIVSSFTILWPPKDWFSKEVDPEVEQFAEATYAEQTAFVRDLRSFVRDHDPTERVVPIPLWPRLEDVTRSWRAGTWYTQDLNPPWTEPTLVVKIPDAYVAEILHGPAGAGEAWLGRGPTWFDDDAVYDVESAAEALAAWALNATGSQPDLIPLRTLITPSSTVDLVEALTQMCRLLGVGLPKN